VLGLGASLALGAKVVPQRRLVVEEAPPAGSQRVGEAGEFGQQQLRLDHRVVQAVHPLGERRLAVERVQLLERVAAGRGARDLEIEREPQGRDAEDDLAAAFGVARAGAVDDLGVHAAGHRARVDLACRRPEAVLDDQKAQGLFFARAERLFERHRRLDRPPGMGRAAIMTRAGERANPKRIGGRSATTVGVSWRNTRARRCRASHFTPWKALR